MRLNQSFLTGIFCKTKERLLKKNDVESGHSMLEVIAVLMMIGLLSLGGMALVSTAMNRIYENDIMNGVYKRIASQNKRRTSAATDKWFVNKSFSVNFNEEHQTGYSFGIKVLGVVCDDDEDLAVHVGDIGGAGDRSITPTLCRKLAARVHEEKALGNVYVGTCGDRITKSNLEDKCSKLKSLTITVGDKQAF